MNTIALGNQRLRRMRSAQINEFIPFAPLKESGAKPSLRSGTPLWGWASTVCIHLMWIQTYISACIFIVPVLY